MPEKHDRLVRHDPGEFRDRFTLFFWVILAAVCLLVLRLWYLQIIRGEDLLKRSENNRIRIREVKAMRGIIVDARGVVLVENRPSFDVVIFPEDVKDLRGLVEKLEALYAKAGLTFPMDYETIRENRRPFTPLRVDRNVSREKLALIETHSLELPGVGIDVMPVREYYYGESMAHVIGYIGEVSRDELERDRSAGYKSGDFIGKFGLEKALDPFIRGKAGGEQVEVNVVGRKVKTLGRVEPAQGYRVLLTIDSQLQKAAWAAMEGRAGAVVALDPRDGSVLALVSRPGFDPNLFNRGVSADVWEKISSNPLHPMENRAIAGQYPPGSTYKLIVAAAALEEGIITPETTFNCPGHFDMGTRTFRCWKRHGHGRVNLHRAIVESCDVYFYNVGRLLGVDRLAEYARAFGLGSRTGVAMAGERRGLIPTKDWKLARFGIPWQPGETISISIGQGYNTATPIQLANAYAAVAGNGEFFTPRIVKRIETDDGEIIEEFRPEKKAVLPVSREHIQLLRKALWGVVNEPGGTGGQSRVAGRDVCGKTGTAQVIGMGEGDDGSSYPYEYRDHALFMSFAPRDNPEIVVAVVAEHSGHGGSVAAPVARKVLEAYFAGRKP
ncbi:MAG: penicillin-binding protein 2 [Pseudomonadota bacterium]|jgi:penicillin-binding protein 2|nr:penicillin-binding protein 2 [Pseudomonadota bacterium]NLX32554.1 penicillin-binding protein 2 [Deltaproteobacteria bacterium]HNZ34967.1 penicillin-binding protein 2 [Syntrophales bacterium]HOF73978.1 penicillin-binding protein 2 [Syntrophales bacterium]HOH45347.1 penicillin-binding protein 2 [Syntrophales bacterium]